MFKSKKSSVPEWIWNLAYAAGHCSLDYDASFVPEHIWQDWREHISVANSTSKSVLEFLTECEPIQAHHFLHCAGNYHEHFPEWKTVLERPDCDQATALMYFSWFYQNFEEPEEPNNWVNENELQLMSLIRDRAWKGAFKKFALDIPEHCLLALEDMREIFVHNKNHPFSLPASFLPRTKSENLYYKLRNRFIPLSMRGKSA